MITLKPIVTLQPPLSANDITAPVIGDAVTPLPVRIPPKNAYNSDMTLLEGFSANRDTLKAKVKIEKFVSEMEIVLELFVPRKYDSKVVQFVANCAENAFCKSKQGAVKEQAVIAICKKYYNEDEALVKEVLSLVLPNVFKTNVARRVLYKCTNFFCWMVGLLTIK